MKYRPLGKTGMEVSEIGFGAWALGDAAWWGAQSDSQSLAALERAVELGVNLIDTAAAYGAGKSERVIREFLQQRFAAGRPDKIHVATKIAPATHVWRPSPWERWEDVYSEAYLRRDVEARLASLGTDCLDICFLHTWTRAWNRDPGPLLALQKLKREGKVRAVGISTPEHDQDSVNDPMKAGLLDVVQVIYNLFEQEASAELLPTAQATGTGIIVRMAFDEGSLTGKYSRDTKFPETDFRSIYFRGERLTETVERVEEIRKDVAGSGYTLPQAALLYPLAQPGVSTVIPGIRTPAQAELNTAVSDMRGLPQALVEKLRRHAWRRVVWYPGG
jgi:aryl-alcohol dehydrogenase-like predicted oxidoreductase